MREIGIIKLSETWTPEYSVNSVVKNQIRLLVSKGYRLRVILEKRAKPWLFEDKVEYLSVLPALRFDKEKPESEEVFREKVLIIKDALITNLQGLDMVLCHDILFLGSYVHCNIALRESQESLKNITWVHWTHSGTSMDDMAEKKHDFPHNKRYEGMPNSIYVSLTEFDKKNVAKRYQVSEDKVFVVYNTRIGQDYLNFDPLSQKIIEKCRLLEADVVSILPINLSRLFKQPEISIYLMAALKTLGKKVRLVFANANGKSNVTKEMPRETNRMLQLIWLSKKLGLTNEEVVFTSDVDLELKNHAPERVVRDLQSISDVYIHASMGESFGLAIFEAALFRNLCVLNEDVEVFHEIFGDHVVWIKGLNLFDEIVREFAEEAQLKNIHIYYYYYKYYKLKESYYLDYARQIVQELESNKASALFSRLKTEFNNEIIYKRQLTSVLEYNHDSSEN